MPRRKKPRQKLAEKKRDLSSLPGRPWVSYRPKVRKAPAESPIKSGVWTLRPLPLRPLPLWPLRPLLEKTLRPLVKTLRPLLKRHFGPSQKTLRPLLFRPLPLRPLGKMYSKIWKSIEVWNKMHVILQNNVICFKGVISTEQLFIYNRSILILFQPKLSIIVINLL